MINSLINVVSAYTFLKSNIKINDLINFCKKHNILNLGLIDTNNLYAMNNFYNQCVQANIKPIIGCSIVYQDIDIIVYAKNNQGLNDLISLLNIVNDELCDSKINKLQSNLNNYANNLIIISSKKETEFKINYQITNDPLNDNLDSIYLPKINFLNPYDNKIINILDLIALNKKTTWDNINKIKDNDIVSSYLKQLKNNCNCIKNINQIIDQCNVKLQPLSSQFINYKISNNIVDFSYLEKIARAGLKARLINKKFIPKQYLQQLDFELSVVKKRSLHNYFLVVYDYVLYARKNGIIVGPGRGSAAGSLLSYSLGITNIDPIEHGLIFERFINLERQDIPDIDIDFEDVNRKKIFDYIFEKYSSDNASHIITFQTMGIKLAIRDVSRVLDIPMPIINEISTIISKFEDEIVDTDKIFQKSLRLQELANSFPIKEILKISQSLLGIPRQIGMHAAGIVITEKPIGKIIPIHRNAQGITITQYSMEYLEFYGIWKMDILGLKNLTIIKNILTLIYSQEKKWIYLEKINYQDDNVYKTLRRGDTLGIFQLESPGINRLIKKIMPNKFDDLPIILSLYRPGPQDQIDLYVNRKNNLQLINYPDPSIINILKPTMGIAIYQEQVIQIASVFAGFSSSKADSLRRAMSKKKFDEINNLKKDFLDGAIKQGHTEKKSLEIFNLIIKFAGYGFNKSHAVAYSIISYQMLYLKTYYPLYFYSSLISSNINLNKKLQEYINEALDNNIYFQHLDLNISKDYFVVKNNKIYLSFLMISGFGLAQLDNLYLELKNHKKFDVNDVIETIARLSFIKISSSSIKYMIVLGIFFDNKQINTTTIIKNLGNILKYANLIKINDQKIDFSIMEKPKIIEYDEDIAMLRQLELNTIGFNLFFSKNFFLRNKYNINASIASINNLNQNDQCKIIGNKLSIKYLKNNQTKENFVIFKINEGKNTLEVIIYQEIYQKYKNILDKYNLFILDIIIKNINNKKSFILEKLKEITDV